MIWEREISLGVFINDRFIESLADNDILGILSIRLFSTEQINFIRQWLFNRSINDKFD